jgi:two-component system, sensor histidine kinase and response regulator
MARLLHTVKGVAATLGAADLATEAARSESQLVANRESADVGQAIASICAAILASASGLQALLQALQQDLQAGADADTADRAVDPRTLQQGLRDLAELLRQSDMAAVDAMAGLQGPVAGALNARFQALNELIAALDFELALRHCENLIEVLEP